jgi:hypothetical protein
MGLPAERAHVDELRRRFTDVATLVAGLGIRDAAKVQPRGVFVPCPWHAERSPSCSITIGPDGTLRVRCFGCGHSGDALSLIAAVRGLDLRRDFLRVLREGEAIVGNVDVRAPPYRAAAPPGRPPEAELLALWNAAGPFAVTDVDPPPSNLAVARFVASRRWWPPNLDQLGIARVLPRVFDWPSWWPSTWASTYRVAALAYEPDGRAASLHARAVQPVEVDQRQRWPRGCLAKGLLLADALGVAALCGSAPPSLGGIAITEGLTDTIAMALAFAEAAKPWAVLGVTSTTGTDALKRVRWPSVPVVVATDPDAAGDRYAREVRSALPRHLDVRRWRPANPKPRR